MKYNKIVKYEEVSAQNSLCIESKYILTVIQHYPCCPAPQLPTLSKKGGREGGCGDQTPNRYAHIHKYIPTHTHTYANIHKQGIIVNESPA